MPKTLSLQNVVVLSEQKTPIVFPPEMNVEERQFFNTFQETLTRYRLPVRCEYVPVFLHKDFPQSEQMLIALEANTLRYSKVLVGLHIFGSIGFIERKQLLVPPDLPPALSYQSAELPKRLIYTSPELPNRQAYPANVPQTTTFKNDVHKQRVMMIEQRRQDRMNLIIARDGERDAMIEEWWNEVHEIIDGTQVNPMVALLKDAVDLMIKSVIGELQEHGAKSKESDEVSRKQEELLEAAKNIRRNF
jgi:hypothetical protein